MKKKSKLLRFLVLCMLALDGIYRAEKPKKEQIVMVQKKDRKKD